MADTVTDWDRAALHLSTADQRAEPFAFDEETIDADQRVDLGDLDRRTVTAPGHDVDALIFHCESE
jgi:hypothetical protein